MGHSNQNVAFLSYQADALSMLRLKFGEPVRFKFLIGESEVSCL